MTTCVRSRSTPQPPPLLSPPATAPQSPAAAISRRWCCCLATAPALPSSGGECAFRLLQLRIGVVREYQMRYQSRWSVPLSPPGPPPTAHTPHKPPTSSPQQHRRPSPPHAPVRGRLARHRPLRPPPIRRQGPGGDRGLLHQQPGGVAEGGGARWGQDGAGGALVRRLPGSCLCAEAPGARAAPGAGLPGRHREWLGQLPCGFLVGYISGFLFGA